jgi:hypothetical protein
MFYKAIAMPHRRVLAVHDENASMFMIRRFIQGSACTVGSATVKFPNASLMQSATVEFRAGQAFPGTSHAKSVDSDRCERRLHVRRLATAAVEICNGLVVLSSSVRRQPC